MNKLLVALTLAAISLQAGETANVTYSKDIAGLMQKHCQQCHRPGEIGPMPLLTYAQIRPWAKSIKQAVLTKKMPPWFADSKYGHFKNDTSLTNKEINALVAWQPPARTCSGRSTL